MISVLIVLVAYGAIVGLILFGLAWATEGDDLEREDGA